MKTIISTFCMMLIPLFVFTQKVNLNEGGTTQTNYFSTIPYQLIAGKLIVNAEINGKPYRFIVDTGAPNMISKKLHDEFNFNIINKENVHDQSNKTDSMLVVQIQRLTLGGIHFDNIPTLVIDNDDLFIKCFNVDGFIGSNMLRNSIIRFSSVDKTITITDNKKKLSLKNSQSSKLELNTSQSNPYIWINLKNKKNVNEQVLFDTGDNALYIVSMAHFEHFKNNNIFSSIIEGYGNNSLGMFGVAKDTTRYFLAIPEIRLNKATLQNAVTVTSSGRNSRIGAKLLDYGIVTVDYKNERFYFEPFNKLIDVDEIQCKLSPTMKGGKLTVGIIWDKELEKQISIGDRILDISGKDFSNITTCDLVLNPFPFKGKEKIDLTIQNKNGDIKKITIDCK